MAFSEIPSRYDRLAIFITTHNHLQMCILEVVLSRIPNPNPSYSRRSISELDVADQHADPLCFPSGDKSDCTATHPNFREIHLSLDGDSGCHPAAQDPILQEERKIRHNQFRGINCRSFVAGPSGGGGGATKKGSSPVLITRKPSVTRNDIDEFSNSELWTGPAYSNSPPPSSLPIPKFSLQRKQSVSLDM